MSHFIGMMILYFLIFSAIDRWKAAKKAREDKEDAWRKELLEVVKDKHLKPEPTPKPYFPDDDPYWEPDPVPKTPRPSSGSGGAAERIH